MLIALSLLEAVIRLGHRAAVTISHGLDLHGWSAFVLLTAVMAYAEGYRALHLRFVPHVITRADEAGRAGGFVAFVLAPLYAMSLVGAPIATKLRAWAGVTGIVTAMHVVRALPFPWRGIVDGAVAVALAFGLASLAAGMLSKVSPKERLSLTTKRDARSSEK